MSHPSQHHDVDQVVVSHAPRRWLLLTLLAAARAVLAGVSAVIALVLVPGGRQQAVAGHGHGVGHGH